VVALGTFLSLLPTLVLFFSYLLFLSSVYFGISFKPHNIILLIVLVGIAVCTASIVLRDVCKFSSRIHTRFKYIIWGFVLELTLLFLLCGLHALKPIHLPQESDVLTYHLFLPLQHLAAHSLKPIPWYWQEMYPMVIQWSMTPLFLIFWPPIKLSTFCIQVALACQIYFIARLLCLSQIFAMFILGCWVFTQSVYLQMGTAMFDHVNIYFITSVIATLMLLFRYKYSWRHFGTTRIMKQSGNLLFYIAGLSVAYGVSTKNLSILVFLLTTIPFIFFLPKPKSMRVYRVSGVVVILTLLSAMVVLLPCWLRVWRYCGNPIFPITISNWFVQPVVSMEDLVQLREQLGKWFNGYGYSRNWKGFLITPLALGFSGNGINNRFDYPLGIPPYLCALGIGLFAVLPKREKRFDPRPMFVALGVIYVSWWFICQQTRFLYPALILLFLGTGLLVRASRYRSAIITSLLFWLFLNGAYPLISKYREEKSHFFSFGAKRVENAWLSESLRFGAHLTDKQESLVVKVGGESTNALLGKVRLVAFDAMPSLLQSGDKRDCDILRRELESAEQKAIPIYGAINNKIELLNESEKLKFLHQYLACD